MHILKGEKKMNKIGNTCFDKFVNNISANETELDKIISSHKNVRDRLSKSQYNDEIVKMVLVGSYIRGTNTKTIVDGDKKIDVDLAVIFKKDSYEKPQSILDKLYNELNSYNEYEGKVRRQSRSVGIELSKTHIDVVPFQEVYEGEDSPLYISAKGKQEWEQTDPIGHINHYQSIKQSKPNFSIYSKALKWWKKTNKSSNVKFPISIAFEEWVSKWYSNRNNKLEALLEIMERINDSQINNSLLDPLNSENDFLAKLSDTHFNEFKKILDKSIKDVKDTLEEENIEKIRGVFGYDFPKCNIINDRDQKVLKKNVQGNVNYSNDQ
jgi:predicted nucleotidyltransferase